MAAGVPPLVNDQRILVRLRAPLAEQLRLPFVARVLHVDIAHAPASRGLHTQAVLVHPRVVAQRALGAERVQNHLARAFGHGLVVDREHDRFFREPHECGGGFELRVELASVYREEEVAFLHRHARPAQRRAHAGVPRCDVEDALDAKRPLLQRVVAAEVAHAAVRSLRQIAAAAIRVRTVQFAEQLAEDVVHIVPRRARINHLAVPLAHLLPVDEVQVRVVEKIALDAPRVVEHLPPLGHRIDRAFERTRRQRAFHLLPLGSGDDGPAPALRDEQPIPVGADFVATHVVEDHPLSVRVDVVVAQRRGAVVRSRARRPAEDHLPRQRTELIDASTPDRQHDRAVLEVIEIDLHIRRTRRRRGARHHPHRAVLRLHDHDAVRRLRDRLRIIGLRLALLGILRLLRRVGALRSFLRRLLFRLVPFHRLLVVLRRERRRDFLAQRHADDRVAVQVGPRVIELAPVLRKHPLAAIVEIVPVRVEDRHVVIVKRTRDLVLPVLLRVVNHHALLTVVGVARVGEPPAVRAPRKRKIFQLAVVKPHPVIHRDRLLRLHIEQPDLHLGINEHDLLAVGRPVRLVAPAFAKFRELPLLTLAVRAAQRQLVFAAAIGEICDPFSIRRPCGIALGHARRFGEIPDHTILSGYGENLAARLQQHALAHRRDRAVTHMAADILHVRTQRRLVRDDLNFHLPRLLRREVEQEQSAAIFKYDFLRPDGRIAHVVVREIRHLPQLLRGNFIAPKVRALLLATV